MSADNGIYILITKEKEYRVAYCDNIGQLHDLESGLNDEFAIDCFGKSTVHSSLNEALEEAVVRLRDIHMGGSVIEDGELVSLESPEHGIQVEDFSDYAFPAG